MTQIKMGTCLKDGTPLDPLNELSAGLAALLTGRILAIGAQGVANVADGAVASWYPARCRQCFTEYCWCDNCGKAFAPPGGIPAPATELNCPNCNARLT